MDCDGAAFVVAVDVVEDVVVEGAAVVGGIEHLIVCEEGDGVVPA